MFDAGPVGSLGVSAVGLHNLSHSEQDVLGAREGGDVDLVVTPGCD